MLKKDSVINIALLLTSVFVTLLIMEFLFPRFLHRMPLTMIPGLDGGLRVLTQTSKKTTVPKNYTALVGDSHAEGRGDWLKRVLRESRYRFTTPDYHSAHIIHRKTGQDVITFGTSGSGSLGSLVAKPIPRYLYLNSLWHFTLEKPKRILVYFYEGNDLIDNIRDLDTKFKVKYDMNHIYDPKYFADFITEMILKNAPIYERQKGVFWKNFLFSRFVLKGVDNGKKEINVGIRKLKKALGMNPTQKTAIAPPQAKPQTAQQPSTSPAPPAKPLAPAVVNKALVGGKEVVLPSNLQAPAVELTPEEIKATTYVFEQGILYLQRFFKESFVGIVYLPSPLSSYEITSPQVSIQNYYNRGTVFDTQRVKERSQEVCRRLEGIASENRMGFLDARKAIKKGTAKEILHGPKDWKHLNEKGYHVLSDAIITTFFDEEESSGFIGCD